MTEVIKVEDCGSSIGDYDIPIYNAVIIPDGATNGDMIMAMFPNAKANVFVKEVGVKGLDTYSTFTKKWWNAPYERGNVDNAVDSLILEKMEKQIHDLAKLMYKTGCEDGYSKGYDEGVTDTIFNTDTYIQGLNDAWEYIKKLGKLTIGEICEIFGDEYDNLYGLAEDIGATEFIDAIKAYEIKQKKMRENCSILNDTCPYPTITCLECEVHCSVERAKQKLKGDKE